MKRILKISISVMLALAMMLTCVAPAFADTEEAKVYAYIGDSMSFDFVGRNYYAEPMQDKIYPTLAADEMAYSLHPNMGHTVRIDSGEYDYYIPGGRTTDAYALLSDYSGDDRTIDEWKDPAYKQAYQAMFAGSDIVTIQMGYSNVTQYLLNNIAEVFQNGKVLYSTDLKQLSNNGDLDKIADIIGEVSDKIYKLIGENTIKALKAYVLSMNSTQLDGIEALLGSNAESVLEGAEASVKMINDSFVYTMASHMLHFDKTIEALKKINPELEIYVMGLINPMQDLNVRFTHDAKDYIIPVGKIFGMIFDSMNLYMKVLSPHATEYFYVENLKTLEPGDTFGGLFAQDAETVESILRIGLKELAKDKDVDLADECYAAAAQLIARGVMTAIKNTKTIDANKLIAELAEGGFSLSFDYTVINDFVDSRIQEDGSLDASYVDQILAHVFMMRTAKGLYMHPTEAAHAKEAELLVKAMQEKKLDCSAAAIKLGKTTLEALFDAFEKSRESFIENTKKITTVVNETAKNIFKMTVPGLKGFLWK